MMQRRVPRKYAAAKKPGYLPVKFISEAQAKTLQVAGKPVPRGTVVVTHLKPTMPLGKLKITIASDGSVRVPRYKEVERGIALERYDRVKNVNAAIRRADHQIASISAEAAKLDSVFREVQGVHVAVHDNWKRYNPAQKKAAINYVQALAGAISIRAEMLSTIDKQRAIERLGNAAEFLKKENFPAALTSLWGVANDLAAKKSKMIAQRQFLSRRGRATFERKYIEDRRTFLQLDAVINIFSRITGPRPLREIERRGDAETLEKISKSLSARREQLLKSAGESALKAASLIRAERERGAIPHLKEVNRKILIVVSETSVIFPERIALLQRSKDVTMKRTVLQNQVKLLHDNIIYWSGKATAGQRINIHSYFIDLAGLAANSGLYKVSTIIGEAAKLFRANRIEESKELIASAFESF